MARRNVIVTTGHRTLITLPLAKEVLL